MKRIAMVVGGAIWFALIFYVSWRVTFPSQAIEQRAQVEVIKGSGGAFELALSDVKPWWTGLRANNVILYEVERGEKAPVFAFEEVRVKAGLFSLLRNQPRVNGVVTIGQSDMDFDVTAGMNKRGTQFVPRVANVLADAFPLRDLAGLAGVTLDSTGGLDIELDLNSEDGMRDAVGDLKITGRDLLITSIDPEVTGGMDLGMEIPLDEVDIHFEIDEGKATVRNGMIRSSLVDTEMEGDITLREDFGRSTLNLTFKLELGDELAMFKGFLKRAEHSDGSFHYKCSGSFNRPLCREDPERGGSARRGSRGGGRAGSARPTDNAPRSTLSDEEREKRRQEALERMRKNRERREGAGSGGTAADEGEELEEIGYADDEEFDDELPPDDEPPLDDELPLDEEPVFDEP